MSLPFLLRSISARIAATEFFLQGKDDFLLGRSSECHFTVRHPSVSRRHARLVLAQGAIIVRDLESRNGTFIEDEKIPEGIAEAGQKVRFGKISFVLARAVADDEISSRVDTATMGTGDSPLLAARARLSKAQIRVVDLLIEGLSEKQVAARLHVSTKTVHNHIQAIYRAFGVHSRSELLVLLLGKQSMSG